MKSKKLQYGIRYNATTTSRYKDVDEIIYHGFTVTYPDGNISEAMDAGAMDDELRKVREIIERVEKQHDGVAVFFQGGAIERHEIWNDAGDIVAMWRIPFISVENAERIGLNEPQNIFPIRKPNAQA